MSDLRLLVRVAVMGASLVALGLTRVPANLGRTGEDVPALGAAPALKLRLFYVGLVVAALVSVVPRSGTVPVYLLLVLLFAGLPTLGHQTIGLTFARRQSPAVHRLWLLGLAYPLLVLLLGATLLAGRIG